MEDPVAEESSARMASEDEELEAEQSAGLCTVAPLIMRSRATLHTCPAGPLQLDVLVVGQGPTALALLGECIPGGVILGSVAWAETDFKGETLVPERSNKSTFCFGPSDLEGLPRCAVIPCAHLCAPHQYTALARGLLSMYTAQLTVVLAELPAHAHHGPEDASQGEVHTLLQTDAARQACAPVAVPYLSAGNLVSDLPAAVLSCAQARQQKAAAVMRVNSLPGVTREGVTAMGASLKAVLTAHGATQAVQQLDVDGAVKRACCERVKQFQSSRVYL